MLFILKTMYKMYSYLYFSDFTVHLEMSTGMEGYNVKFLLVKKV